MQVRLGEYDFDEASQVRQDYAIENIYEHPQYINSKTFPNDIAIIELTQPVVFNRFISAICLPTADDNLPLEGDKSILAGWGDTSFTGSASRILLEVELSVKTLAECRADYGELNATITSRQLCAGDAQSNACSVRSAA